MNAQVLEQITHERGYVSAALELGAAQRGILAPGSANLLITGAGGRTETFRGLTAAGAGGRVLFNFSDGYASLNDYGSVTAKGSIFMVSAGRTMGIIGAGAARYNGAALGVNAASVLQYLLYRNGSYTDALSGPFQAGREAPSAVQILPMTSTLSTPGKTTGAVAVEITRVGSALGGESNASTSSPVVIAAAQSIRVGPFPALDSNGQDRWGIYVTFPGFGARGPFYFLKEIADTDLSTIGGVARCYEIEWTDADLSALPLLAPRENYPPPAGVFAVELGGHVAVIGCYNNEAAALPSGVTVTAGSPGNMIAISLLGQPEAFPPTGDYLLALPEPPVFCLSRAADGYVFIFCRNSVHVLSYVGGTPPLQLQTILATTGVAAPHNVCLVGEQLYLATGNGLARVEQGGLLNYEWSADLLEQRDFVAANVVLGYDANQRQLVVAHSDALYCYNVVYEAWGAPVRLSLLPAGYIGEVRAAVTVNNQLKLSLDYLGTFSLYDFNVGNTGSIWIARSGWLDGGAPGYPKLITRVRSSVRQDTLTTNVITSMLRRLPQAGAATAPGVAKTWTNTLTATGLQALKALPPFRVRELKAFQFEQSGFSLRDGGPVQATIEGTISGRRL